MDDIAEAAGVSPRTYDTYFSSREQAIVAAISAERALRIAAAPRDRPADEPLARAVVEAVVEQHVAEAEPGSPAFALLTSAPSLRASVLAAAVSAAARVAAGSWLRPAGGARRGAGHLARRRARAHRPALEAVSAP
ncbi:hypothetical protein [Pseudonocardia sp. DLS-67]